MNKPTPKVDQRRAEALFAELLARAQTWIPGWQPTGTERDFGHALLRVAARLSSEVTERLDRTPAKAALGLLDWLGVTRLAGHAARMPVVFKMTDNATDTVFAPVRTRIQANVGDTPVAFETGMEVQLVPAPIGQIVGVDPDADAIYFPPADVLSLEPPTLGPTEWTVKSLASANSTKLQLTPPLGLQKDTILQVAGLEYRIVGEPQGDLVTVEPTIGTIDPGTVKNPVGAGVDIREGETVKKVRNFIPFDGSSRNLQEHALYIGDDSALNLIAPAKISLAGSASLPDDLIWEYWGKLGDAEPTWNKLDSLPKQDDNLFIDFPGKSIDGTFKPGSIESREIEKRKSRWIRARRTAGNKSSVSIQGLRLTINCSGASSLCEKASNESIDRMPKMEGVANNTSLVLNERFYPLGKTPRQLDSFYLACEEAFSKPGAETCIHFNMADPTLGPLAIVRKQQSSNEFYVYGIGKDGYLHRYMLSKEGTSQKLSLKYIGLTRPADQHFTGADHTRSPVVIVQSAGISVLVWSDKFAWIWDQQIYEGKADLQWRMFGNIGYPEKAPIAIKQVALLGLTILIAIASDGSMWYRPTSSTGSWIEIVNSSKAVLKCIVPIQSADQIGWKPTFPNVFFAIGPDTSDNHNVKLFRFIFSNSTWINVEETVLESSEIFELESFAPMAILFGDRLLIASRSGEVQDGHKLSGYYFESITSKALQQEDQKLQSKKSVTHTLEEKGLILGSEFGWVVYDPGYTGNPFKTLYLLLTVYTPAGNATPEQTRLAWWTPLDADPGLDYEEPPPRTMGTLAQTPAIPNHSVYSNYPLPNEYPLDLAILVPGSSRDVLVGNFIPLQRKVFGEGNQVTLVDGIKTTATFVGNDFLQLASDDNVIKFDKDDHPEIELKNDNFYVFSGNDKIDGSKGTRYPGQSSPAGKATWSSAAPTELTIAAENQNIDQGCLLILSYNALSGKEMNKVCTVAFKPDPDKPNTVIVTKDLSDFGLPTGTSFDYYLYVGTNNNGGYSASISPIGSSRDTLTLTGQIPTIEIGWVLVLEYKINGDNKYSVHTVESGPTKDGHDITTLTVNKELPQDIPAGKQITYYVYNHNLGTDSGFYAVPFTFNIKSAVFLKIENGDQAKLETSERVLHFLDTRAKPKQQKVEVTSSGDFGNGTNFVAVLTEPWQKTDDGKVLKPDPSYFAIDDSEAEWAPFTADVASNPDLSWEYWNGSGWWKIEGFDDGTEDLKQSGNLKFNVPTDIQATDILGRKSWWIRARLIGGDYGRESFDVVTSEASDLSFLARSLNSTKTVQTQSVVVNTENIHPPFALGIGIAYSLCEPIAPKYLLTLASKSWLDQSDANRTPGATVDAFVPVSQRLWQLSGADKAIVGNGETNVLPCDCDLSPVEVQASTFGKSSGTCIDSPQVQGAITDKTQLKVLSTIPARNAAEVAIDSPIVAVFSEPLNPATVNVSSFQLRDNADALLPVTITYNPENNTATLRPDAALAQALTYTAIIRGGTADPSVSAQSGNPLAADIIWTFTTAASSSRAIYLVFDKEIKGTPIRILFLLEDRNHDQATPMIVEALRNNRFEPVGVEDKTRALGESGLLTLSLDGSPSLAELFGISGFWLRLRPGSSSAAATWRPCIKGAYVNAVWASAEETQETEILGSSDGSPSQLVVLTRPPVLRDSLQLRVRELLGDEEMQQLTLTLDVVKENVPGLPGRWVLWKEVVDPGDTGPDERVYALDPFNGEIRFGDGVHGAIPPIGRDAIVAFEYRHGGEAAANRVPSFTPLNLVSPIAGVESAITPDNAAGGSDAENVDTVRCFAASRLRHRDRAVSLRDLEDLALHFSDDIAQARAFSGVGSTRLVVVLGSRAPNHAIANRSDPDPSQALSRELRRYLLEHASPALARRGALTIVKADRVNFRIDLRLRVVSLDVTGSVGEAVKLAVQRLFDPAFGGFDGLGWRIGNALSSDDVAACLLAVQNIDNIDSILITRDKPRAQPVEQLTLKPAQLAWLLEDGITIQFTTKEVQA